MTQAKHLFIGFGDIARRCCAYLRAEHEDTASSQELVGIARSDKPADGVTLWRGDVRDDHILKQIAATKFDTAVITLTPSGSDEDAYREGYLHPVEALCSIWQGSNVPERVIFVSSTSVYAQSQGEWVDHDSDAQPTRPSAKIIRACEQHILQLDAGHVLRFSGIYGPGRDYLLRQVAQGNGGNDAYTNRIHVEDCARAILFLMACSRDSLAPIYLASDKAPVKSWEIRQWLAEQLDIDAGTLKRNEESSRAGNKRCDSKLLDESGFVFRYPTFKEGYIDVVKRFRLKTQPQQ